MIIETRYNVGDTVWIAQRREQRSEVGTCPVCNGTGLSPYAPGKRCDARWNLYFACRNGIVYRQESAAYVPVEATIKNIYIEADTEENYQICDLQMGSEVWMDSVREEDAYSTFEEAQEECNRRNYGNE